MNFKSPLEYIDLYQLEVEEEKASVDKSDLFDFYNKNWGNIILELVKIREDKAELEQILSRFGPLVK